jgi:HSP20 family protein
MAEAEKQKRESRAISPWRPFASLSRWEREMERMFDELFERRWSPFRIGRLLPSRAELSIPAVDVDVYEEKDQVVVKAELPGVDRENVEVSLADNILTLKGEKKKDEEIEEENYYRAERSYGAFVRTIELPVDVQAEKAKATFKNGVLEIRVPKSEEARRREVKIKVD